jgi:hypothetical protein
LCSTTPDNFKISNHETIHRTIADIILLNSQSQESFAQMSQLILTDKAAEEAQDIEDMLAFQRA